MTQIHYTIPFSCKEKKITDFSVEWMELEKITLTEVAQNQKEILCIFSLSGNTSLSISTYRTDVSSKRSYCTD